MDWTKQLPFVMPENGKIKFLAGPLIYGLVIEIMIFQE